MASHNHQQHDMRREEEDDDDDSDPYEDSESSLFPGKSFRLSTTVGIELIHTPSQHAPLVDFASDGLHSISFQNYTGILLVRRRRRRRRRRRCQLPERQESDVSLSSAVSSGSTAASSTAALEAEAAVTAASSTVLGAGTAASEAAILVESTTPQQSRNRTTTTAPGGCGGGIGSNLQDETSSPTSDFVHQLDPIGGLLDSMPKLRAANADDDDFNNMNHTNSSQRRPTVRGDEKDETASSMDFSFGNALDAPTASFLKESSAVRGDNSEFENIRQENEENETDNQDEMVEATQSFFADEPLSSISSEQQNTHEELCERQKQPVSYSPAGKKAAVRWKQKLAKYHDDDDGTEAAAVTGATDSSTPHLLERQFGGTVYTVLQMNAQLKRNIPEEIRFRRMEQRSYVKSEKGSFLDAAASSSLSSQSCGNNNNYGDDAAVAALQEQQQQRGLPPTPLHELCSQPKVTLEQLMECLQEFPKAIQTKDTKGRFPLHVLGDNETLLMTPAGKKTATAFCTHLMNFFPDAVVCSDAEGFIPFAAIIADWIAWANDQSRLKNEYTARSDLDEHKSMAYPGTSTTRLVFPRVEIWEEVEWSIAMISTALEILGRNLALPTFRRSRGLFGGRQRQEDERNVLVRTLVEKLPQLVMSILLVDEDGMDSRARALETILFRRIFLCPASVDRWLTDMLKHGGVPSQRAVNYLCLVSDTQISDYTGSFGSPLPSDWKNFAKLRESVFRGVGELKGTIASLVTLDESDAERAAGAAVVWDAMATKLSKPFALGLILIDLVLHLSLMLSFRNVAGAVPTLPKQQDLSSSTGIITTICLHYLFRKACEAWAMWIISRGAFLNYIRDVWNIFSTLSIFLTIITVAVNNTKEDKSYNGLNSFVIGLLWIKVLAFLKVVNKQMATFIMALSQILFDIRWFMVVLAVCVFMFGDMFHVTVATKDGGAYCGDEGQESGAVEDFCTSSWKSYLRTYAILLGDFELDDVTTTSGTTILFLIFTLFGVVILLNVLIAIISDSYEKATLRGFSLFGRARVMFVAQNEALEHFLKPRKHTVKHDQSLWIFRIKNAGRYLLLTMILFTSFLTQIWLVAGVAGLAGKSKPQEIFYFCLALILALILGAGLWVVGTFLLDEPLRWLLPDRAEFVYNILNKFNDALVTGIANLLFGIQNDRVGAATVTAAGTDNDEWSGRMHYIEKTVGSLVTQAKQELKNDIFQLKEMYEHGPNSQ